MFLKSLPSRLDFRSFVLTLKEPLRVQQTIIDFPYPDNCELAAGRQLPLLLKLYSLYVVVSPKTVIGNWNRAYIFPNFLVNAFE